MDKLRNEHVTLRVTRCHRTSTHIYSVEKLLHHIWFTIWRQQIVFLVFPTLCLFSGRELVLISVKLLVMCVSFLWLWKKSFYFTLNLSSKLMFSFLIFFFGLKMFLIHWNSDSFPLHTNGPHSPVLRPSPRQQRVSISPCQIMCRVPVALSRRQWGLSLMRSKSVFITSVKAAVLTPSPKPRRRAAASALLLAGDNLCNGPPYTVWCTEALTGWPQRSRVTPPKVKLLESSGLSCFESWIMDC